MSRTGKRQPYKTYTKEFKLEALKLMETSDCSGQLIPDSKLSFSSALTGEKPPL